MACSLHQGLLQRACFVLTAQIPFHAYEHSVPKPDISCIFLRVQFLETAAICCQQPFTALLVWWNTGFFFILFLDSKSFFPQMMGAFLSCVCHPFWLLLMTVTSLCAWNLVRWGTACCYVSIFWLYFSTCAIPSLPFPEGFDREGSGGDSTWTPASSKSSLRTQLNLPAMQRAAAPFWCLVWWDQKEADATAEDIGSSHPPAAGRVQRHSALRSS